MGAPPARITAEEFVTPPELARWSLADNPAGRVGGVRLELAAEAGQTQLRHSYQQVPLRVLPPFSFGPDRPALLYLLNPTAGLMDGDAQLVQVHAGPGARAVVVGQSATRIHPCLRGFSTQQWQVHVAPGAVLVLLPGPAIPFAGCRYAQRVSIDLAAGAGLVWGDIWFSGRYARGELSEHFRFEMLVQELTVRREGRLVFRDRFCWRGPWDGVTAAWHFGNAPAVGSVYATIQLEVERTAGGAAFVTGAGDTCIRWCGPSEDVAATVARTALAAGAALSGDAAHSVWLPPHVLAPNHWFSRPLAPDS